MNKIDEIQAKAVDFICEKKTAYIAADMGLGKTKIVIDAIRKLRIKVIVFGPLKVIQNTWPAELKKWAPELTYVILHGNTRIFSLAKGVDVVLINYDGLPWLAQQTGSWERRAVVFDEASMIKSHSTRRFKILKAMRPMWLPWIIMLSGTPAPNSLMDLWAQYFFLDKGEALGRTISEFRTNYCSVMSYPGVPTPIYSVSEGKKPEIMKRIAPLTFRLKAEDYIELPEYIYNEIPCNLSAKLMTQYRELERDFCLILKDHVIEAPTSAALSNKLRQFIQGAVYAENREIVHIHYEKLDRLKEIVDASTTPILCAINFRSELSAIQRAIPGTPFIAGGTSGADSTRYLEAWNRGDLRLLLCNPASAGYGLNAQFGGFTVIHYCLTWNLEYYQQFNARLRRMGQAAANVFIHHLVVKNTIDDKVSKALINKESVQSALLNFLREYTQCNMI